MTDWSGSAVEHSLYNQTIGRSIPSCATVTSKLWHVGLLNVKKTPGHGWTHYSRLYSLMTFNYSMTHIYQTRWNITYMYSPLLYHILLWCYIEGGIMTALIILVHIKLWPKNVADQSINQWPLIIVHTQQEIAPQVVKMDEWKCYTFCKALLLKDSRSTWILSSMSDTSIFC
jgi:hypothetical protein